MRWRDDLRVPDCHAEYDVSERRVDPTAVIVESLFVYGIGLVRFALPRRRRCLAGMGFSLLRLLPLGRSIRFRLDFVPDRLT